MTASAVLADVEVSFPEVEKSSVKEDIIPKPFLKIENEKRDPVYIEGELAYFSVTHSDGDLRKREDFEKIKQGMTLKEIISLLGPGVQSKFEGIGFMHWRCVDGRVLMVWPSSKLNEEARYFIDLHGADQKHTDVAKLAEELISSVEINSQKVSVTLKQDTHQAKAYVTKTYEVGETFQKIEPLPRIDFTITKIKDDVVYCRYFYEAPPDGLLHYSEDGSLMLKQAGHDGADQPASVPESKPKGN